MKQKIIKKKNIDKKPCGCYRETLSTPADAIMAVAILAVASDGKLKKKEIDNLKEILISNPLFDKVEDAGEYMGCIAAAIVAEGRDSVLEASADLLSRSLRETAYAWAVYMVATDRKFVKPEHRLLEALRKKLGLHGELAGKINAVIPMLGRIK